MQPQPSFGEWTPEDAEAGLLSDMQAMAVLARRLPKAELHVHFLGAIRPSFPFATHAQRLIPTECDSIPDFFDRLRRVALGLTDAAMFEAATLRILEDNVDCGCRHVEMMVTPGEIALSGVPLLDALKAMGRAFAFMKRYADLTGGILLETYRADPPEAAFKVIDLALEAREAGVPILGIGNDGDITHPVIAFAPAFAYAKKQGFRVTCHLDILQDVIEGLELPLDRADHAYDLKGRPELMAQYRDRGIGITSAPGAVPYLAPGLMASPGDHPLDEFRRFGLKTCVSTDDPAFMHSDLAQDYMLAQRAYGWTRRDMLEVAMISLEMAWIDEADRDERLAGWRAEAESLLADPRRSVVRQTSPA